MQMKGTKAELATKNINKNLFEIKKKACALLDS